MAISERTRTRPMVNAPSRRWRRTHATAHRLLVISLVLLSVLSVIGIVIDAPVSVRPLVLAIASVTLLAFTTREVVRASERRLRAMGRMTERVLIVGEKGPAASFEAELRRDPSHGFRVVGRVDPDEDLTAAAIDARADAVMVLAGPELDRTRLRKVTWAVERLDLDLLVAPGILDVAAPRLAVRPMAGMTMLHLGTPEFRGSRRMAKALLDRVVAAGALLVLSVPLLVLAMAIRLDSPGRAFFRQRRVGLDGAEFMMIKLRSMTADAEQRRQEVAHLDRHGGDHLFKIPDDPRVTRLGRILRRYSIDELPQLINVVRGEMSLIGPRPALPSEVMAYASDTRRRLRVKPGLTGLWQVSGRSDLTVEESVRLDLWYVDNWSPALDALIVLKTLGAVIGRRGAY